MGTESIVHVELDSETGEVSLKDLFVVHDCGNVINAAVVEGQMVGSFAQGLGGTMMEEFKYDAEGQPLSSTFMDYLIPTALDMPRGLILDETYTPSPYNNGYKGMSEGGCIGTPAAVANAVDDALRKIGAGAVPATPLTSERVWSLLQQDRPSSGVKVMMGVSAKHGDFPIQ